MTTLKMTKTTFFKKKWRRSNPLNRLTRSHFPPRRNTVSNQSKKSPVTQNYEIDDNFSDLVVDECPEQLSYSRSGLQHSVLKKLRTGKIPVENHLDLHGKTVAEARQALLYFIAECEDLNIRCAVVVHGKGYSSPNNKPIIKAHVNHWLREAPSVLAFNSALPSDGGTGAVYVLLKRVD